MSHRGGQGGFYSGSRLLTPLVGVTGLPIDQVNFLACQLVALGLGYPLRIFLNPRSTSPTVRHAVEVLVGFALVLFCFGSQMFHLVAHATIGYILMQFVHKQWMPRVVLVVGMGYLAVCHIYRQTYDYGGYTLDITGPLMICVMKLSSLAYSLHDAIYRKEEDLSDSQKKWAVKKIPDVLTFYSYIFCFHGVMCGPFVFFNDYIAFIDGSCYDVRKPDGTKGADVSIPSPVGSVLKKIVVAAVLGILMMLEPYVAPWDILFDNEFLYNTTILWRTFYMLCSTTMHRPRYYFAWKLGELVNNASGLGFSGYDDKGSAKWGLLNNVDIWHLETCTTLRENIGAWNILTTFWLRQVVYDRFPASVRTNAVFLVSAFWHGFYPGYYITFVTGALFTVTTRLVRTNIRPYFQTSDNLKFFYDAVTFTFVRVANSYLVAPFMLLEFVPSIKLYLSFYGWLHIGALAIYVFFTFIRPTKRPKGDKSK